MKKTFLTGLFVILLITLFQNFCFATTDGDVYVSAVNSTTTLANWYPRNGMDGSTTGGNDWTYTGDHGSFWVVPTGYISNGGLYAVKFQIHLNSTAGAIITSLGQGNLLGSSSSWWFVRTINAGKDYEVNYAASDLSNHACGDGLFLAKINFNLLKPIQGGNPITIDNIDFRYYANNASHAYTSTGHDGAIKFFLGDFTNTTALDNIGNGAIDAMDLAAFSAVYWNVMDGLNHSGVYYYFKYNIGPTTDNTYYAMPDLTQGYSVDFEDLVIFAIGYGKTPGGLNIVPLMTNNPLEFSLGTFNSNASEIKVPVNVSGSVIDLRGFSLTANISNMEFIRVEKQGVLNSQTSLLFGKSEGNTVFVDASVFEGLGIGMPGTVANIVLKPTGPNPTIALSSVKARNTNNESFVVKMGGSTNSELPASFGLNQNYPNPFNPSTMINYQIPKSAKVTINIYDISGKLVTTLVNGVQDAGKYSVEWKAGNSASGVYFYRINAGSFTDVKKMILAK